MIRLLLNGQEVDFTNVETLDFNYRNEDTDNPTVVKNKYSKTIVIPGTPNNNKIFGDIFRMDRKQEYDYEYKGIYFDPSKRVPFVLLNNGDLIESGYFQLESISRGTDMDNYTITLYGGIGDFFYSLMYDEDGNKLSLADLKWDTFFNGEYHSAIDGDEFGIQINSQEILRAFLYLPCGDISKWNNSDKVKNGLDIFDWLTFIPSYNGYYEDFDNNKCLLYVDTGVDNTFKNDTNYLDFTQDEINYTLFNKSSYEKDGVTYYRGYARADLGADMTEWEIRDLRAYKQRPALRMRRIIEACCKPENNGGYKVNLDPEFFNDDNPYWNDTYVALPLLSTLINKGNENELVGNLAHINNTFITSTTNDNSTYLTTTGTSDFTVNGNVWDFSSVPLNANLNVHYIFSLNIGDSSRQYDFSEMKFNGKTLRSSVAIQVVAYDALTNKTIGYSKIYNFTSNKYPIEVKEWKNTNTADLFYGEDCEIIGGHFENGRFVEPNSENTVFELTIEELPIYPNLSFKLIVAKGYNDDSLANDVLMWQRVWDIHKVKVGSIYPKIESDAYVICKYNDFDSLNNVVLKKKNLLSTDDTPYDYLTSYCKLYGLRFICDDINKTIDIVTRNTYFNSLETVNLDECIDRSREYIVTPLTYNYKWYDMSLENEDTRISKRYEHQYGVKYGSKRINTNYNFSQEENKLFDGNIFKNGITTIASSDCFYNWRNGSGYTPNINARVYEYVLFNGTGSAMKENKFYVYPYRPATRSADSCFGKNFGKDAFPKICYYDEKNKLVDFSNNLLLRNGLKSIYDNNGNPVWYSISDDIPEMYSLNGNPCYLYCYPNQTIYNSLNSIQWTYSLPVYTKYKTDIINIHTYGDEYTNDNNLITYSLDFGSPREVYCDWKNDDTVNIYSRFWKAFIEDQCDVNTRIVSCYVLWKHRIDDDALRKIYYFDNAYWMLNSVEDYNPVENKPTKCEFIKVQSINNYNKGQKI